jgi:hypothetical protein
MREIRKSGSVGAPGRKSRGHPASAFLPVRDRCPSVDVDGIPAGFHSLRRAMWGYAEGNATVVGIVVVIVGIAAIAYVVRRLLGRGK